jgi:hypothetical protein
LESSWDDESDIEERPRKRRRLVGEFGSSLRLVDEESPAADSEDNVEDVPDETPYLSAGDDEEDG